MFRICIHLSLIAALLGCPSSCLLRSMLGATSDCAATEGGQASPAPIAGGCCGHHTFRLDRTPVQATTDGRPPAPRPCNDDDSHGGPCQCICGGAVFENAVSFDAADAVNLLDALAIATSACDRVPAEVESSNIRSPFREDILSGRDICRLHALMLC